MKEKIVYYLMMEDKLNREQTLIAIFPTRLKAEMAMAKLELAVDGCLENWVSYYVNTSDKYEPIIRPWRD